MTIYEVSANGTVFGTYEADSEQAARDLCAQDAGYESESDMTRRLEQESELVAAELNVRVKMLLIDATDGTVFGKGTTEQECITDAVEYAYAFDKQVTKEWVESAIIDGTLIFDEVVE